MTYILTNSYQRERHKILDQASERKCEILKEQSQDVNLVISLLFTVIITVLVLPLLVCFLPPANLQMQPDDGQLQYENTSKMRSHLVHDHPEKLRYQQQTNVRKSFSQAKAL